MKELKRIPFSHDEDRYEVVVMLKGNAIHARPFLNRKPASPATFSVEMETASDLNAVHHVDAIQLIIQSARESVTGPAKGNPIRSVPATPEMYRAIAKLGNRRVT